jgi:O-antigen/teichoic acid export membrane protein
VEGAVLVYVGAAVVVAAVGGYFWHSCTPSIGANAEEDAGTHVTYRDLLRSSLPLLVVASMYEVIRWTDTILLGVWESTSVVGVYEVAFKTSMLTNFVLMAANSVAGPRFASLYTQGDREGLEKLLQQVTLLTSLLTIPIVVAFIVFPQRILWIFGSEFGVGSGALVILVLGQFIGVATGGVIYVLVMTGKETIARNVTTLSRISCLTGFSCQYTEYTGRLGGLH